MLGLERMCTVVTESAHAVVSVPAPIRVWPSCESRWGVFSWGGRLLDRISWKIVGWEEVWWEVFFPLIMPSI